MKNKYLFIILIIFCNISAIAQTQHNSLDSVAISNSSCNSDSLNIGEVQSMSLSYYNSRKTLERNYDFEIFNKQRRLRMWSNELRILGYASFLGICFGGPVLFPDASLWILIPAEVVVGGGIIIGSNIWANNLRKRADALNNTSLSVFSINSHSTVILTQYSTDFCQNLGVGIGYKYNF